ncbi:hypothetical protein ACFQFC_05365 [Amorphoplanes digitatis]|uniref:Uncharacterized protein n=1 Tax=Actinoplanes digitatis TaxID=1868 RepID=A0A7W7HZL6_9ACTN|nr:hypothetical protein [Actinoplanes digitatis]MBB4763620.1 hypothetical protein [Actinoplanes digitatis]
MKVPVVLVDPVHVVCVVRDVSEEFTQRGPGRFDGEGEKIDPDR